MNILLERHAQKAADAAILRDIRIDNCNIAIWERPAPSWGVQVLEEMRENIRFTASSEAVSRQLAQCMQTVQIKSGPHRSAAIDDIAMLAKEFASIMRSNAIEVRLEIITTDSCRKFHADYVLARLISTYVGIGTQWISNEDAALVRDGKQPKVINTLAAGDVGLFKGRLATQRPAIHRSPPIKGTGEKRLLLVLNPAEDL